MWNLAKENGWEAYTKLTDEYSVKLEKVIEDKTLNIPDIMKKFENIHNSIKFKAFGKVTIKNKPAKSKEANEKEDVDKTEQEEVIDLHKEQESKIEQELNSIKACNNGRAGQIWQLRKKVLGDKKAKLVPKALRNPRTGKLEVTKNNIK